MGELPNQLARATRAVPISETQSVGQKLFSILLLLRYAIILGGGNKVV